MKAIEEIKSQLKDAGFNNDSLLVTSIEKAFNELQKENEDLKQEKEALRLGYNEVMGETLLENTKLKERIEELKASKRKMAIDCQMMMEDRDNKYIENTKLKQDNAWKDNKIELMQKIWELMNLLDS